MKVSEPLKREREIKGEREQKILRGKESTWKNQGVYTYTRNHVHDP